MTVKAKTSATKRKAGSSAPKVVGRRHRGRAAEQKAQVDHAWFFARMGEKKLSLRKLARLMSIDVGGLSRMFRGQRRMVLDEAADLARFLDRPYEEVMRRANVGAPTSGASVPVLGVADSSGAISPGKGSVQKPLSTIANAAIRVSSPGGATDGWVLFFSETKHVEADAVGRLSIVQSSGKKMLVRVLARGTTRGTWTLTPLWGEGTEVQAVLEWAAPVVGIRC